MRQIGFINEEPDAERFGNYLLTQGVKNHVEQMAGGAWEVWIENDDLLDRGRAELDQFRANPSDARYDADKHAEKIRKQSAKAEAKLRKQHVDVRTSWAQPARFMQPVTIVLVLASVLLSLGTRMGQQDGPVLDAIWIVPPHRIPGNPDYGRWGTLPEVLSTGQVWRLITPIFLHLHAFHLIFNMIWLLDLGAMIETRRGWLRFLGLVLASALASNLAQYFWDGPGFGGMSGVVYALFGYAWMKGRFQPHLGIAVAQQTVFIMMVWLVLCMVPGFLGNVANAAHVVGLVSGVVIAYVPYGVQRLRRKLR